jgi:hypothetical protein
MFAFLLLVLACLLRHELMKARAEVSTAKKGQDRAEKRAQKLQQGIRDALTTEAGKAYLEAAVSKEEVQRLRLLLAWKEYRRTMPLSRNLERVADVRRVELDGDCLPRGAYRELLKAKEWAFPAGVSEKVNPGAIADILSDLWTKAGLDGLERAQVVGLVREAFAAGLVVSKTDLLEDRIAFEPGKLSRENLCLVIKAIRQDLEDDRKALAKVQKELFDLVITDHQPPGLSRLTDPGEVLQALVAYLKTRLGLLPEVVRYFLSPP